MAEMQSESVPAVPTETVPADATLSGRRLAPMITYLRKLHETGDRGALAALRRGVGRPPGTVYEMFAYVVPFLPAEVSRWQENAYFLIASLFALYPDSEGHGDLGQAFRRAIHSPNEQAAVERRFTALLAADPQEFDVHLRHAVTFLQARAVPIDWDRLLIDVLTWQHPNDLVQRRWARSFWSGAGTVPAE